jgi:hypothetical protein
MNDNAELAETREALAHATSTDQIVRLRARAEALERRIEEGLMGRSGKKVERLGQKMQQYDKAKHPHGRGGKFALTPGHGVQLAKLFMSQTPKKLTDEQSATMEHFSKDRSGTVLYHRGQSEFMGKPGSTHTSDRPISTSEKNHMFQYGNVVHEIHVKKGKTFRPNDYVPNLYSSEQEHVLAPGTKFKVKSTVKVGNETRVVAHVG